MEPHNEIAVQTTCLAGGQFQIARGINNPHRQTPDQHLAWEAGTSVGENMESNLLKKYGKQQM
jgi:hypothetical protein